jgi:hypothetical protein
MVRNELVTINDKYVQLKKSVRQTRGQAHLQQLTKVLTQLLKNSTAITRSRLAARPTVLEVTYPSSSPKGLLLMQKKHAEALQAFLSELHAGGVAAALETPPKGKRKGLVTRTRVLVLTDDLEQGDSKSIHRN